jgi:hypothetical protein
MITQTLPDTHPHTQAQNLSHTLTPSNSLTHIEVGINMQTFTERSGFYYADNEIQKATQDSEQGGSKRRPLQQHRDAACTRRCVNVFMI